MKTRSLYTFAFLCFLFMCSVEKGQAQAALVQQAIDKIGSYQRLSYHFVYKEKEYTDDTLVITHQDILLKAPADTNYGYWFRMEALNKENRLPDITIYNGQNLIDLHPEDSTYVIQPIKPNPFASSLPGYLKVISNLLKRRPAAMAADTIIDAVRCSHVVMNTYDTIIGKEHFYSRIHIFIDQLSGLPNSIIIKARSNRVGDGITNYYAAFRYTDYKLEEDSRDIAAIAIPEGFHPPLHQAAPPALLAAGTQAPDWELYSAEGKKLSLAQLKGKVVLLDFFFIGCDGCMRSLKPLNRLHEKYKNVEIVSLTFRDKASAVTKFRKDYHIAYPIYINAGDVAKQYHVMGFPTFYFIDKKGTIADVMLGYGDDFENKVAAILDPLL